MFLPLSSQSQNIPDIIYHQEYVLRMMTSQGQKLGCKNYGKTIYVCKNNRKGKKSLDIVRGIFNVPTKNTSIIS